MSRMAGEHTFLGGGRCLLVQADITAEPVDAIVNAANAQLRHGGGIAGAIIRRGGAVIQQESDRWVREHGLVAHAAPAITGAGGLPCLAVIHAVGPVWGEGGEDGKMQAAVAGALALAEARGFTTMAVPAISTGIFGFPKARAAALILDAIESFFRSRPSTPLREVRLTILDDETIRIFEKEFQRRWA